MQSRAKRKHAGLIPQVENLLTASPARTNPNASERNNTFGKGILVLVCEEAKEESEEDVSHEVCYRKRRNSNFRME